MLDQLIQKISEQTGLPPETVQPVVGALLAHLGDVLPAPLAHSVAILLGVHPADDTSSADPQAAGTSEGGLGGLLGGLAGALAKGGGAHGDAAGQYPGAASLASVAESLLAGLLSGRR